jgi:predicted kinase
MNMSARPCLVLLGGGAGAGKTSVARAVVRRVANAVLLDKDRILGSWVDRVLSAAGADVDRDSRYYWEYVRPEEYVTLETIAYDHLALGKVGIIDAPLRPELENSAWLDRVRAECAARGAGLVTVWVVVSPETAWRRMEARGEPRDRWKLDHWAEFLARQPYGAPSGAAFVVENEAPEATDRILETVLRAIQEAQPAGNVYRPVEAEADHGE